MLTLKVRSRLWLYPGPGGWHFITLPAKNARVINISPRGMRRGWGSMRVKATIGKTTWNTSIFPDRKSKSYVLPVKADVRKKEAIKAGDTINFSLKIED